jgi:ABC-type arginine transport system permease subunit
MLVTLATVCTNIIRDIPELVLMPLIYYGCTIGTNNRLEWNGNVHAFMRISAPLMSRH